MAASVSDGWPSVAGGSRSLRGATGAKPFPKVPPTLGTLAARNSDSLTNRGRGRVSAQARMGTRPTKARLAVARGGGSDASMGGFHLAAQVEAAETPYRPRAIRLRGARNEGHEVVVE